MGNIKRKLIVSVFVLLSLLILAGNGWSQQIGLPHAFFDGLVETYLDNGTNDDLIFLYTSIFSITYADGTSGSGDSILWSTVTITGSKRNPLATPGTTFTPATLTVSNGTTTYLSATLKNIQFVLVGGLWRLNPNLDINNPSTLNLDNLILNPGPIPSRYIQDLQAALGSQTIAGMTMTLDVFNGNITGDSQSAILEGLLDGVPVNINHPPVANAGPDITIPSNQVATTTVQGTVTDADSAYTLTCRWMEGTTVLRDWTSVGINGECPLNLSALSLGIGIHTLTLEVNDGQITSSDNMTLTINNSVPNANAGNDITITSEQVAATMIQGVATDFDGNALTCRWTEGLTVLRDWTPAGLNGACPLNLSALSLGIGIHTLTLTASDGLVTSSDDMILTIANTPPFANAGENLTITSDQIAATTIQGVAADFDGDALSCLWTVDGTPQTAWSPAGTSGECPLNLSSYSLGLGAHTLILEAYDGLATSSNIMILTINNSAPHAAPGGSGVYEINTPIILPGDVSDFDGDMLNYQWTDGTNVLCSGNIQSVAGGTSVLLPDCVVSNLSLGMHTISLQVSDGFNLPDTKSVTVQIIDNIAPKLKPKANLYILWPPNHRMVDIAIAANATDNSGCPVTLSAIVKSNEPEYGLNRGDQGPDWTQPVIDQNTGMIYFQLRAERSGRGKGRIYTITITATDCSGNISTAKVKIRVPHDKDNIDREREDREEHDRKGDDREDRDD